MDLLQFMNTRATEVYGWSLGNTNKLMIHMKLLRYLLWELSKECQGPRLGVDGVGVQKGPLLPLPWRSNTNCWRNTRSPSVSALAIMAIVICPNGKLFFDLLWNIRADRARKIFIYFPECLNHFRWLSATNCLAQGPINNFLLRKFIWKMLSLQNEAAVAVSVGQAGTGRGREKSDSQDVTPSPWVWRRASPAWAQCSQSQW